MNESKLKCECGHTVFGRTMPVYGTWYHAIEITGSKVNFIDGSQDNVKGGRKPKTIVCEACGKRRKNPLQ